MPFKIPNVRNTIIGADIYVFYLTAISGIEPLYIEAGNEDSLGSISSKTVDILSQKGRYKPISYLSDTETTMGIRNWVISLVNKNIGDGQLNLYQEYLDYAEEIFVPILENLLQPEIFSIFNLREWGWCVNCSGKSQYIKFYKSEWQNKGERDNAGLHISIDQCFSRHPILRVHVENKWYNNAKYKALKDYVFRQNGGFDFEKGVTETISGGLWMMVLEPRMEITIPKILFDCPQFLQDLETSYSDIIGKIDDCVKSRDQTFPDLKHK